MRRPLHRLKRQLRRDPDAPIRAEIRALRRTASTNPAVMEMCDDVERLLAQGRVERRGPRETKPREMPPEWKGCKPPPENP
jgi:hypothetical protein